MVLEQEEQCHFDNISHFSLIALPGHNNICCFVLSFQELGRSVPYHHLCCSLLQMAATTSLHTLLFDESVIKLLTYQPPSLQVVIAGENIRD